MKYSIPEDYELIDLVHEDIPVRLSQTLDGIDFKFLFRYNESADIYTVEISDAKDNLLIAQKVTYGKDLLARLRDQFDINTQIIPLDVSYEKHENASGDPRVGIDTFGKNVELVVLRG